MEQNLINALLAAFNQHLDTLVAAKVQAALAAQPKQEPEVTVDMDKLRELVAPIVASQIDAKIEAALDEHRDAYDHDDFITADALDDKIDDKIDDNDALERVVEDKVREVLRNASVSIDV